LRAFPIYAVKSFIRTWLSNSALPRGNHLNMRHSSSSIKLLTGKLRTYLPPVLRLNECCSTQETVIRSLQKLWQQGEHHGHFESLEAEILRRIVFRISLMAFF
jgi:hypothetical protein